MASKVTRFSQRSPVIRTIGSSFLLLVIGAATLLPVSESAATIGLRPSIWAIRTARSTCASIQAASTVSATTGTTANLSVLSQNKNKGGSAVRCSEESNRGDARRQPNIPAHIRIELQLFYWCSHYTRVTYLYMPIITLYCLYSEFYLAL